MSFLKKFFTGRFIHFFFCHLLAWITAWNSFLLWVYIGILPYFLLLLFFSLAFSAVFITGGRDVDAIFFLMTSVQHSLLESAASLTAWSWHFLHIFTSHMNWVYLWTCYPIAFVCLSILLALSYPRSKSDSQELIERNFSLFVAAKKKVNACIVKWQ